MVNGLSNDQPFFKHLHFDVTGAVVKTLIICCTYMITLPKKMGGSGITIKPLEGVLWSNQDFMGCHECRMSSPWSRRQELQHHVTSKKSEQSWVPNSLKSDVFFGDTCDLGILWQWHHVTRDPGSVKIKFDPAIPFENQSVPKVAEKKTSSGKFWHFSEWLGVSCVFHACWGVGGTWPTHNRLGRCVSHL